MARLRKAVAYRKLERPYTRKSKYRNRSYVRAVPNNKIVKYVMGDTKKEFPSEIILTSGADIQVRHNSLESARLAANRYLERNLGKKGFQLKLRVYPHHILRENPLASGAGADRMSTGMKKSFGKSIGLAAQVRKGQTLLSVTVEKGQEKIAREALRRSLSKFPMSGQIL
ncbi:50S ribosomal protein L16 [Candidatus Woesearchaeota archaeon]|nr:MAG: 50S ribosomal protein L16 [Candidatus Woesearchaeota archaeon]